MNTLFKKPGLQTTEFWTTLGSMAVMTLVLLGVIPLDQSNQTNDAMMKAVLAVINAVQVISYARNRTQLKASEASVLCPTCNSTMVCPACVAKVPVSPLVTTNAK